MYESIVFFSTREMQHIPKINLSSYTPIISQQIDSVKGLSDFLDLKRMSFPKTFSDANKRLSLNWTHFKANYILISALVALVLMLSNIWLLLSVLICLGVYRWISNLPANQPTFGLSQLQWNFGLGFVSLILFFASSAFDTLLELLLISSIVVILHAVIREEPLETDFSAPLPV